MGIKEEANSLDIIVEVFNSSNLNTYAIIPDYAIIPEHLPKLTLEECLYLYDFHSIITCYSAANPQNWSKPWMREAYSFDTREGLIKGYEY